MKAAKVVLVSGAAVAGAGLLCAGSTAAYLYGLYRRRTAQKLHGRVVLITGGSRGLGLALAEEFGRRGAKLILTARDPWQLERARQLLLDRKIVADAADVLVVPADLRHQEEAEQLVQRATEAFEQIDVLVNNAGVVTVGPIENQAAGDFHDVMESNFFSGVHSTLAVLPQMLARRSGTIVNIASVGGKVAVPHLLPYTASKFAMVGFSEGLHAELRARGVHVLTVCPGLMRTGSHLNARFTGDAGSEYRWFSLAANLPGISVSAAHAARRIVRAVVAGETEIALGVQALAMARTAGLAPGAVACAMSAVHRLLPHATAVTAEAQRGGDIAPASALGSAAARRYNQTA